MKNDLGISKSPREVKNSVHICFIFKDADKSILLEVVDKRFLFRAPCFEQESFKSSHICRLIRLKFCNYGEFILHRNRGFIYGCVRALKKICVEDEVIKEVIVVGGIISGREVLSIRVLTHREINGRGDRR